LAIDSNVLEMKLTSIQYIAKLLYKDIVGLWYNILSILTRILFIFYNCCRIFVFLLVPRPVLF
jgi:hypothetical protein